MYERPGNSLHSSDGAVGGNIMYIKPRGSRCSAAALTRGRLRGIEALGRPLIVARKKQRESTLARFAL